MIELDPNKPFGPQIAEKEAQRLFEEYRYDKETARRAYLKYVEACEKAGIVPVSK